MMIRLLGLQSNGSSGGIFKDVRVNDWYAKDIATAAEYGIVNGMGKGVFAPNALITREQASKILANIVRTFKQGNPQEHVSFGDHTDIASWAQDDVTFLSAMNLVIGYEDVTFRPRNKLTRAESAALIFRLMELMKNEAE